METSCLEYVGCEMNMIGLSSLCHFVCFCPGGDSVGW